MAGLTSNQVTRDNLRAVLKDMDAEPGWIEAGRLYNWYAGMAREDGFSPVSKKAFGLGLAALKYRPSIRRRTVGLARCWFISARAFRDERKKL